MRSASSAQLKIKNKHKNKRTTIQNQTRGMPNPRKRDPPENNSQGNLSSRGSTLRSSPVLISEQRLPIFESWSAKKSCFEKIQRRQNDRDVQNLSSSSFNKSKKTQRSRGWMWRGRTGSWGIGTRWWWQDLISPLLFYFRCGRECVWAFWTCVEIPSNRIKKFSKKIINNSNI